MPKTQGLFRKFGDSVISSLGYIPVKKKETVTPKSVALSMTNGYRTTHEQISRYGLRKPGRLSFRVLRQLADADPIIRISINLIKRAVSQAKWEIAVSEDAELPKEHYAPYKKELKDLFKTMNGNNENMRVMLSRTLEDVLALDAGAIEVVRNYEGSRIMALNSVDAASIRPVYDVKGILGDPAYKQIIEGNSEPVTDYTKDELFYIMANPQNDVRFYGFGKSNIESIMLQVQASLEADMFNIRTFSKDNIPPGYLDLGDVSDDIADAVVANWQSTVIGNTQAMKFIWGEGSAERKYVPFKTTNKDMQFNEYLNWLSRIKLAIYGLSGLDANLLQDVNYSTAQAQVQISKSRGVQSYKQLMEEYLTRHVVRAMGEEPEFRDLEFKFKEAETLEEKKLQSDIDKTNIESGVVEPDEIREREGMNALGKETYEDYSDEDEEDVDKIYKKSLYD